MKKIVSLLLAAVMLAAFVPAGAVAQGFASGSGAAVPAEQPQAEPDGMYYSQDDEPAPTPAPRKSAARKEIAEPLPSKNESDYAGGEPIRTVYSGTCGTNVTWTLDTESGVLEISGTGAMTNYGPNIYGPWYSYRSSVTSVVIDSGVTSIGSYAFYYCTSLSSVAIPDSVTSIGSYAFCDCSWLTSVTIPDSVTSIGQYAFCGCSSLTSVTIGNGVMSIGYYAFWGCTSLTSVTIPDSVTSVGGYAFSTCHSLTLVTIGNGVTGIPSDAFWGCRSLTTINVASANPNFKSILGVLFNKEGSILICYPAGKKGAYTIPSGVMRISYGAFYLCSSLTSVKIPDSVMRIDGYAFYYCSSLTSVTIPDSVTSIGYNAFDSCSSLTSVTIPDSVTSIGDSAFRNCSSLTSVTIGSSVRYIDAYAFYYCSSLTSVTIPDGVTSIGDSAFYGCTSLTSATFLGAPPTSFGNNVFDSCASGFTIYYTAAHASEWAPNGQTTWNGYPIALLNGESGFDGIVNTPYKLSPGDDPSGVFHTHFSDYWFTAPSGEFNYELAKASLAASAGSFSLNSNPTDDYVRETLQALGFTKGFEPHKFDNNTAIENTCGHAFAYKVLPNGDYLIAAAIRSSGYGSEWESNFNVMPDYNSYMYSLGFKEAADGVYTNLDGYIDHLCSAEGISRSDIRVWTFGFSRGGAVANLLAARLNQESGIPQSQIYAYTFATPKTVLRDAQIKYGNIFNIVQETDAAPHVPLRTWDYTWYGNNYYLPSRTKTGGAFAGKLEAMTACFQHLMNESGRSDVYYYLGATQELTIDLLLDYVDDVIKSRLYYRDRGWQEIMRSVGKKMGESGDFDVATLLRLLVPDAWYALNALFEEWDYLNFAEKVSELYDLIAALTNYKTLLTNNPAGDVVGMLINFIAHYAVRFHLTEASFGSLSLTDNYEHLFALLGDAFRNRMSGALFMQHWPETYMAWLDSASDASLFERSSYKRVSLKCPIDVYVYDGNNDLVGRIVDDIVDDSIEESVYCACDMLGEKTVFLPDDDNYRIEIVAREDCEIDLINEYYTDEMELVSVECYIDVPMDEAEQFEAEYEQDKQECTLTDSETEIEADFVSEPGEEIPEFTVELTCEGYGVAAGDGYYTLGETVSLSAVEIYGSTFVGWFDGNGELVSTENVYNYSITSDGAFIAVFEGGVQPGDADGNGVVNATDALLVLRYALGLIGEIGTAGDVNGDGIVNANDALMILRATLGLITL